MGHRPACTWFLEIISSTNVGVCVCPPLRALITSYVKGMDNNQIRQFYGFPISLYYVPAIDKLNGHGFVALHVVNARVKADLNFKMICMHCLA